MAPLNEINLTKTKELTKKAINFNADCIKFMEEEETLKELKSQLSSIQVKKQKEVQKFINSKKREVKKNLSHPSKIKKEEVNFKTFKEINPSNFSKKYQNQCFICSSESSEHKNPIIYCDFCNASYHLKCYSIPKYVLNYEKFYCDLCEKFREKGCKVKCEFCPLSGGCLKSLMGGNEDSDFNVKKESFSFNEENNYNASEKIYSTFHPGNTMAHQWAHITCAVYYIFEREIFVKNSSFFNRRRNKGKNKDCFDTFEKKKICKRKQDFCEICGESGRLLITCFEENCKKKFHGECAVRAFLPSKMFDFKNFKKRTEEILKILSKKLNHFRWQDSYKNSKFGENFIMRRFQCVEHLIQKENFDKKFEEIEYQNLLRVADVYKFVEKEILEKAKRKSEIFETFEESEVKSEEMMVEEKYPFSFFLRFLRKERKIEICDSELMEKLRDEKEFLLSFVYQKLFVDFDVLVEDKVKGGYVLVGKDYRERRRILRRVKGEIEEVLQSLEKEIGVSYESLMMCFREVLVELEKK